MLRHNVACDIKDAKAAGEFGDTLKSLRQSGELARMANPLGGPYELDGFRRAAQEIQGRIGV
jgi:hypothetical protein